MKSLTRFFTQNSKWALLFLITLNGSWPLGANANAVAVPLVAPFRHLRQTFSNPILRDGADPWVIRHEDHYYYTCTSGGDIFVGKSPTVQTIGAQTKVVWTPPKDTPYSKNLWAPELHFL